ncbi:MAG: tetratricopeptide repeat protein [Planctomycetes bacterium]|nr:tetratricopeptide repeat protein [Planctomycetota bacterium]
MQCVRKVCGSRAVPTVVVLVLAMAMGGCGGSTKKKKKSSNPTVAKYVKEAKDAYDDSKPKQSIEACNKAIKLDSKCQKAYAYRGLCYGELGDRKKALADFTKAIELDPKDMTCYEQRAAIYRKQGKTAAADRDKEMAAAIREKRWDDIEGLKAKKYENK